MPLVPKLDLSALSIREEGEETPRLGDGWGGDVGEGMSAAAAAAAARRHNSHGGYDVYSGQDSYDKKQKEERQYHIYSNSPRVDYSLRGYGATRPSPRVGV